MPINYWVNRGNCFKFQKNPSQATEICSTPINSTLTSFKSKMEKFIFKDGIVQINRSVSPEQSEVMVVGKPN